MDGDPSFPVAFYETLEKQFHFSVFQTSCLQDESDQVPMSTCFCDCCSPKGTIGEFCHHKINKRTTPWTDCSQVRQFCKPTSLSQAVCLPVCVSRARKKRCKPRPFDTRDLGHLRQGLYLPDLSAALTFTSSTPHGFFRGLWFFYFTLVLVYSLQVIQ